MQVPSDKVIMYTYLKAACEVLFEEHDIAHSNEILNQTVQQFAQPGHEMDLFAELDNFREWICDELDDNMGWYFLDDNLNDYMNRWHHDKLI